MTLADRAPRGPRILTIDLERTPGTVNLDVWEPRDFKRINYVHPDRWDELPSTLCYSARWYGERSMIFAATWQGDDLAAASWELYNAADIVVTYNGDKADNRWLSALWVEAGLGPPSPYKSLDLYKVAGKFGFESRSLRHLCDRLGVINKAGHYSIADARAAVAGDQRAQARMKRYNAQDVRVTEAVYDRLGAWITTHPHHGMYNGKERCCYRCGSEDLRQDGVAVAVTTTYARVRCADCGAWNRLNFRKHAVTTRAAR